MDDHFSHLIPPSEHGNRASRSSLLIALGIILIATLIALGLSHPLRLPLSFDFQSKQTPAAPTGLSEQQKEQLLSGAAATSTTAAELSTSQKAAIVKAGSASSSVTEAQPVYQNQTHPGALTQEQKLKLLGGN